MLIERPPPLTCDYERSLKLWGIFTQDLSTRNLMKACLVQGWKAFLLVSRTHSLSHEVVQLLTSLLRKCQLHLPNWYHHGLCLKEKLSWLMYFIQQPITEVFHIHTCMVPVLFLMTAWLLTFLLKQIVFPEINHVNYFFILILCITWRCIYVQK